MYLYKEKMNEYENIKRITYETDGGVAVFIPVCEKCGRFVKADKFILACELHGLSKAHNATCKKCGRVDMLFEGFN